MKALLHHAQYSFIDDARVYYAINLVRISLTIGHQLTICQMMSLGTVTRDSLMVRSTLLEDFALAGPKGRFATSNAKKRLFVFLGICGVENTIPKGHGKNTSPFNILVLPENAFISSKNPKIV